MKIVCVISLAVALFLSFKPSSSSAGRFEARKQQEQEKKKEKEKEKEKDDSDAKVSGELGSKENAVQCSGPPGERAYLNRLRCSDGKAPKYFRVGSFAPAQDGHILDGYNVKCEEKDPVTVFMDMYHDHVEKEPIAGFTIVNDEP